MKNSKEKMKENGITLIALVITVIILIILASVTVTYILGEGGLIYRAQQAKNLTEKDAEEEQKNLNSLIDEFDKIINEEDKEKYSLTIEYQYAEGEEGTEELPANYIASDLEDGTSYSTIPPAISGYVAVPSKVSETINGKDENITVIYYKDSNGNSKPDRDEKYSLTIYYAYIAGEEGEIALPTTTNNEGLTVGHQYSVVSPDIPGYVARPAVVSDIIYDSDKVITVYYYKDENGNGIPDSEEPTQ